MIRCLKCFNIFDEEYEVCPHCGYIVGALPEIAYHIYPGTILNDRYVIGTTLGHGGFGITYNAWDQQLNIHVAVKEYFPSGLVNRIPGTSEVLLLSGEKQKQYYDGLKQFMNEAKQTVQFAGHPNIVHIYDYFEKNNTAYIIMEYLDGISLKELLKQWGGKLDTQQTSDICISICDALTEIHKNGVLHRDINPSNIFICLNGQTKLIDFGSARISDSEDERTRSVIITPGYAPPEQYRAKSRQDSRTDIYALCAVLYRCVTGVKPVESLDRTVDDTLESPIVLNEEVEDWLDMIIMRGMALNQELRFKSAEELKTAILEHRKVQYPEERIKQLKKFRLIAFVSAIVLLLGAGGGIGAWFYHNRTKSIAGIRAEAELTVWISDKEGSLNAFNEIYEDFKETEGAEKITLDIVQVKESEYEEKLSGVMGTDECPDIFFTEFAGENYDGLADISIIYDSIDLSAYSYLDEYSKTKNASKMLPLGYDVASVFVNKSKSGFNDDDRLTEFTVETQDISGLTAGAVPSFAYIAEKNAGFDVSDSAISDFVSQDAELLLAGASEYKNIQNECAKSTGESLAKTVAGNYYAVPVTLNGKGCGVYTDMLSVSASSKENEYNAAILFIVYLLSDQGQDILHIQNNSSLPLNKTAAERFVEYNSMISYIGSSYEGLDMR